jgi:hypothetical protein
VSAARRCFSRIVLDADIFWVCAKASSNFLEKGHDKTRGFTSCLVFSKVREEPARRHRNVTRPASACLGNQRH